MLHNFDDFFGEGGHKKKTIPNGHRKKYIHCLRFSCLIKGFFIPDKYFFSKGFTVLFDKKIHKKKSKNNFLNFFVQKVQ